MAVYSSVAFCINSFVVIKTTMGPSLRFLMYYSERCSIKQRNIQYGQQYHSPGGVASNIKIFNRVHIHQFGSNNIFIHLYISWNCDDCDGLCRLQDKQTEWSVSLSHGTLWHDMVYYGMLWYGTVWLATYPFPMTSPQSLAAL